MAERVEVLLTEKEVDERINAIGEQISKDREAFSTYYPLN